MIDHVSFHVPTARYEEVVTFYLKALAPLGYTKQLNIGGIACGFGDSPHNAKFWIGQTDDTAKQLSGVFHFGFSAKTREVVDKFFKEGIKAGGKDNGKPGIRKLYHPNYYAAFLIDPVGNNVEVVNHSPH
ncbi:glyoxalase/bleomycin resistance protein/dioxygenase [Periconia macrospinosa]|uniref:Glyoxalase/bleomycin resistance protein/dioxygenase n=1 Tax=Periconia macrospinosa TaxID=97972 RepID=A0A2V1D4M4_9PLEO|nr:glyoxalase/bleomycin resistance protein/dioxygenase [Periconia macrospinosa]